MKQLFLISSLISSAYLQSMAIKPMIDYPRLLQDLHENPIHLQHLQPEHINKLLAIKDNGIDLRGIMPDQLKNVDMRFMTPEQINRISSESIAQLTRSQMHQLRFSQINGINFEKKTKYTNSYIDYFIQRFSYFIKLQSLFPHSFSQNEIAITNAQLNKLLAIKEQLNKQVFVLQPNGPIAFSLPDLKKSSPAIIIQKGGGYPLIKTT